MLTWVGKKPLTSVRAYPAQNIERFDAGGTPNPETDWSDWPDSYERGGLLFHGDNKDVLAHLLANGFRGKIKLIYIDPPFDSGADYVRKVQLRGELGGSQKLDGEEYTLGEQIQYTDIWANDNYLQFMYERLLMLKELLAENGSIYLHCDVRRSAQLRLILDEVFGAENFQNEIVWERTNAHNMPTKTFGRSQDVILLYSKSDNFYFEKQYVQYSEAQLSRYRKDSQGRLYTGRDLTFSSANKKRQFTWKGTTPPAHRSWGFSEEELDELWEKGLILKKKDGTPRLDGLKTYLEDTKGKALTTLWTDISRIGNTASERTEYPTQKPEELVERVIRCSSQPGDLVLDAFVGSGTTVCASQSLGRRWIGCDINKGAIQTTGRRLQAIMTEQAKAGTQPKQQNLVEDESEPSPTPCQFSFTTWRVNDYDLQIQHNEAVNLACEYIGVTRNRADSYFDGTHGTSLVKIVPFNHPFTPLDLEDLKEELARRPDEERDIELVCLGMELAAQAAVEEHNRNRSRGPNRVHVIELRTDDKYGGFIQHEPLTAHIHAERQDDGLHVEVTDVLSPTIVKRLNMEEGLFKAQIDDWRAVVDAVMIDTNHDGDVFNIALSDVPEKKNDLVDGHYVLDAPPDGATIAVKIIDRLGEEVLVTQTL